MKKFAGALTVLAITAFLSTSAQAQEENVIRPLTKQGSAAFMLNISGLGNFGLSGPSISGDSVASVVPSLGVKYFLSDDMALRVLLGFTTSTTGPDSTASTSGGFGIAVGGEYHFRPLYSTSPYIGAQIGFSTASSSMKNVKNATSLTGIGLGVFGGFDWFFTRGMAVGAEVGLNFNTVSGVDTDAAGTDHDRATVTNIAVGTSPAVHFIVYF